MRKRIEQRLAGIELEREEWEKTKHIKLLSALFDRPNILEIGRKVQEVD